jgi:hypothetical protein
MRGKERITWKESSARQEVRGGVVYRGNSLEGVVTRKMDAGAGMEQYQVTKVTGRWVGEGDCRKGREYTSRPRGGPATGGGEINPVKEIRKLFKF